MKDFKGYMGRLTDLKEKLGDSLNILFLFLEYKSKYIFVTYVSGFDISQYRIT